MTSRVVPPTRCKAWVDCTNGIVTTGSCQTKRPLIDRGGCSEGCCDYYECPDCGYRFTVEYD